MRFKNLKTPSSGPHRDPEVTVIIPVRNGESTLERCLQSVFASQGVGPCEVIVVDDGSTDRTASIAGNFPCTVIRHEISRGPAVARNRGVREARAQKVVFVDADVYIRPDTLAQLAAALEKRAGAFGTYDPVPANKNFATLLYHTLSCRSLQHTSETTRVFYSYCAGIHRDVFLEVGGFDTSFTSPTFEDVDLGCRLASRGLLSSHMRDVKVVHAAHYDVRGLVRAYFRKSRDLARLLLSRNAMSLGDEGWTNRKNWIVLACAWGTIAVGPLALWLHTLWAIPWAAAAGGFLVASTPLFRSMARYRWIYGPVSVLGYLGIHYIATVAMFAAYYDVARGYLRQRTAAGRARSTVSR